MSTPSFWEQDTWLAKADVVIAGAGLLGLWTAWEIKQLQPGARVLVVEKGAIPTGASTRNAGFACFGSPTEMWSDAIANGTDNMLQLVEMRYKGIEKIKAFLGAESIGFEPCGGFECYTSVPENFEEKLQELNAKLAPIMHTSQAFVLASSKMNAFGFSGFNAMVENQLEGCIHSGLLVSALTQMVAATGVRFLFGTTLQQVEVSAQGACVYTSQGNIQTSKVVYATNAWLSQLPQGAGIAPARGQVLVTKPLPGLAMKGTFHFDEGFYYWRHLGNRILLGGARNTDFEAEQTLDLVTSPTIQQILEMFLQKHLHLNFGTHRMDQVIDYRWSGLMAMSISKQPVLQQTHPGVWMAMCCNGMGVALSPIFASQVARQVLTS